MANGRDANRVGKRALILGAIAFRSSLEVTKHQRVVEVSDRLLPWITEIGCGDELDPSEREILETAFGGLSDSQKIDANWAGEAAAFFCWMLNLAPPLELAGPSDQSELFTILPILRPEAKTIVLCASLREYAEIEDTCRKFILIRSALQEQRVGTPVSEIVQRVNLKRLNDAGVVVTDDDLVCASKVVAIMTPQQRHDLAGLYVIRYHAADWSISNRATYFTWSTEDES